MNEHAEEIDGSAIDADLLTVIVKTVEQALAQQQLQLAADRKSRLIALLYSLYEHGNEESISMDNVARLIDYSK